MEERPLGGSGIAIARIVLGCGSFGGIEALEIHLSSGDRDQLTEVFS